MMSMAATGLLESSLALGGGLMGYIIPFLFVLTLIVFIHELGHFLVARWCGVKVEAFSIGFGRAIASWRDKHGTVWKIGWLPLGGYVRFLGDDSAASTPNRGVIHSIGTRGRAEQEACFHLKPLWQRSAIVAAGPVANFLLAIAIFAVGFMVIGEERVTPRLEIVPANSAAAEAGLRAGDVVLTIDGRRIEGMAELDEIVGASAGRKLTLEVDRQGQIVTAVATPVSQEVEDQFGNQFKIGSLGVQPLVPAIVGEVSSGAPADAAGLKPGDVIVSIAGKPVGSFADIVSAVRPAAGKPLGFEIERAGARMSLSITPMASGQDEAGNAIGRIGVSPQPLPRSAVEYVRHDPFTSIWKGVERTGFIVERTLAFLGGLVMGREDATQVSGPLGIAKVSGEVAQLGFLSLINLAAVLSISIGLINLFPIPMLDGGHLLYYGYEAVRGRPMGERAQELGFRLGLAFVITLMVFATWNDLVKLRIFG